MAQVSRQLRKMFLLALPPGLRQRAFDRFPNFRKAAPDGLKFVFGRYLGDLRVNIDTHYTVEKYMWTGSYDADLTALLRRHVKPGHTCFDVGANVGPITLALAQQVGDAGRVVAVEAAPPTFRRLQANLRLNPALEKRVTPVNLGAGSQPGKLYWNEESDNPGNGWLGPAGTEEVRIVTVDSIIQEHGLQRLDFMKIDVEGMELDVLQGAGESLRRFQPTIYFETLARFKHAGGKGNFQRIGAFLSGLGYELHRIGRDGALSKTTVDHLGANTVAIPRQPSAGVAA